MKDWKHQEVAKKRFRKASFFGLLFDCGTGKTRTAIGIAEMKQLPVLVIAPKNLLKQWRAAIHDTLGKEEDVLVVKASSLKTKKFQKRLDSFLS